MICPNCEARLRRTERTGSVCGRCKRPFALDPRVYGRGMHDLRIRRRVQQLTDNGRRKVTLTQLWYLARSANDAWGPAEQRGLPPGTRWLRVGPVAAALVVLAVLIGDGLLRSVTAVVCLVLCGWAAAARYRPARSAGAVIRPTYGEFRTMMRHRWVTVYGALPPGIVDDETYTGRAAYVAQPRAALLCPDRAVRVFLEANGIPLRLKLAVAGTVGELPGGGVPVVVLHDASAQGALLVPDAREALPRRVVVDAGLPVRAVRNNRLAVRLVANPTGETVQRLRGTGGLLPEEADWLAGGWWSPVAAVPPALLESALERAVERAVERGRAVSDPDHRRAASLGFLTWPQPRTIAPREGRTPR